MNTALADKLDATALYGNGTAANPAAGSIAAKVDSALQSSDLSGYATTSAMNTALADKLDATALYGNGTAANPAAGSIAAKVDSALQSSDLSGYATTSDVNTALYGSGGSAASPVAGSIQYQINNKANAEYVNTALYGDGGTKDTPITGSMGYKVNAALYGTREDNGDTLACTGDYANESGCSFSTESGLMRAVAQFIGKSCTKTVNRETSWDTNSSNPACNEIDVSLRDAIVDVVAETQ
jgi:hypothetical protein